MYILLECIVIIKQKQLKKVETRRPSKLRRAKSSVAGSDLIFTTTTYLLANQISW